MKAPTKELEAWSDEILIDFSDGQSPMPQTLGIQRQKELDDSLAQGGERLREALCSVPFYAEGERKAMERGGLPEVARYWKGLFANERNLHRPPKTNGSSTAAG